MNKQNALKERKEALASIKGFSFLSRARAQIEKEIARLEQESPTFQLYIDGQPDGEPFKSGSREEALETALEADGITLSQIDPKEQKIES